MVRLILPVLAYNKFKQKPAEKKNLTSGHSRISYK